MQSLYQRRASLRHMATRDGAKFTFYILFLIFIFGTILRLFSINYGLPYLYHPDEARIILDTFSMGHRLSLLPERPDYALLYRYFLLLIFGAYFILGKLLNIFSSPVDFAMQFLINPANIFLISRIVSVVFGAAIGILAYYLGRNSFGRKETGIIAFIFVMFEFQLFQHSQWALHSIVFSFFTLPAFYFMFRLIEQPAEKHFIYTGLFCGLAISIQNQGIFLIPSLIITYAISFRMHKNSISGKPFLKLLVSSLLVFIIFSLIGNLYWFFIFDKAWLKYRELVGVAKVGFSSAPPFDYNIVSMFWWFINELIRQDMVLGVIMVLGFFYACLRRTPQDFIYIAFVMSFLYFTSNWGFRQLHNNIALLPVMCLFGARFVTEAGGRFLKNIQNPLFKKVILVVFFLSVVAPLIYNILIAHSARLHKDTRILAKEWIEVNMPVGSKIGIDWSIFSVPLEGEIPFLLRNPIAEKYYENNIQPLLGDRYKEYLASKKTFKTYELMYWADKPIWPKDMPQEVIREAEKEAVYRDLYSRFIFKDMEEVINDGVEYLIITSYSWGFFLLNDSPYKKNLFNPFIKDNPVLNYSHADYYINDKRHGILFFLVQHGRVFYETLLYNKNPNIELIKEFYPTDNLGPDIKIYKINTANMAGKDSLG